MNAIHSPITTTGRAAAGGTALQPEERPLTVRQAAPLSRASARKRCIFGLSESRFPISA